MGPFFLLVGGSSFLFGSTFLSLALAPFVNVILTMYIITNVYLVRLQLFLSSGPFVALV